MYLTLPESAAHNRAHPGYLASAALHAAMLVALLTKHGWTAQVHDEPAEVPLRFSVARPIEPPMHGPDALRRRGVPSFSARLIDVPISIPANLPQVISVDTP